MRGALLTLLLLAGVVSAGCSPVYKVEYTYGDAANIDVQACVLECGQRRLECKEDAWRDYQYCVDDLRREEYRYRHCIGSAANNQDGLPLCMRPIDFCFRPNYSSCTEDYAGCYERCGGTVTRTRKCVANCKGAEGSGGS